MNRRRLTRYAWVSIGAAVVTMALKLWAYGLTGSVGLLSDAVESLVNLAGGVMALAMLTVAARPADEEHAYGHGKAEYFSSGVEGTLILIAGIGIAVAASQRLVTPEPLEQLGLGLAVSGLASLINLSVAMVLMGAGKRYDSITLQANAHHLLTDVWTSAGVLVGVGAVALTGWERLDAVVALLVASTILWAGAGILRRTVSGLMDTGLASADRAAIRQVFARYESEGVQFHALRTRQAGAWRFVSVHVLAPGYWTIHRGHALLERIEADIRQAGPNTTVFTHLESLDDPASWEDIGLERARPRDPPTPGCPAAE